MTVKRLTATIAATLLSTAALADNSTRYNDLRLDTSNSGDVYAAGPQATADAGESQRYNDLRLNTATADKEADVTFSSRNSLRTPGEGYIYGGFGPGNDSR